MFVHSSAMTQIKSYLMEKNVVTNCSQVTVPVLADWTKRPFGHYTIMKLSHQIIKYLMPSKNLSDAESKHFSS